MKAIPGRADLDNRPVLKRENCIFVNVTRASRFNGRILITFFTGDIGFQRFSTSFDVNKITNHNSHKYLKAVNNLFMYL